MKTEAGAVKSFFAVFFLNALLAFPVMYVVYKYFNPMLTMMDSNIFMEMAKNGTGSLEPPFRYRFVVGSLVHGMRFLPGYNIFITYTDDPIVKKDFFHFVLLNFTLTLLTSGMVFLYLRNKLRPAFAYLGSLLYLFAFFAVDVNLVPMSDAACQLAVICCVFAMEKKKPFWFALAFFIGIFSKETILFVIPAWVVIRSFADRRNLLYLLGLLPAVVAYFTLVHLNPAPSSQLYYQAPFLLHRLFTAFNPGEYDRPLIFHIFLSQATLIACLLIFLYLKFVRKAEGLKINPELLILIYLIWMGGVTGLGNNTGRFLFLAFPAIVYFEAMIFQTVAIRLGYAKENPVY